MGVFEPDRGDGIRKGEKVTVIKNAPLHDPIDIN